MKPILIILAIPLCLFIFVSAMYFSGVSKGLNYPMEANPVEAVPPSTDTIHDAARRGNINFLKYYLAKGADVNVQSEFRKYTPLHEAVVGRKLEVANFLIENGFSKRILILDLDVHQGNGTAEIFRENKNVFTASFHGEKNYPFRKETSDFDYGFKDGASDKEYLNKIKYDIPRLIDNFEPDFIFYLSGVDIIENDKLGRLAVSIKGCKERDRFVLNYCKTNRIPVQVSMGGGYSPILKDIIEAHSNTFRLAQEIYF